MLSTQDNELLTRVGPETPMGELMRRYWVPAAFSHQIENADGPLGASMPRVEEVYKKTSGYLPYLASCRRASNRRAGMLCRYKGRIAFG